MSTRRSQAELLACAGRLLLENGASTSEIHRILAATSRIVFDDHSVVDVAYGGVSILAVGQAPALQPVHEYRHNTALQLRVHSILHRVCRGELKSETALAELQQIEAGTSHHNRWLTIALLGIAAASLAGLLGADSGAVIVAGLATGLGLLARQELGRAHASFLLLPLTAAFIGAVLGGFAFRLHWTQTPGLAVIVPSLMLVPGPQIINGLFDLIDNYLPMSLARLGLAAAILLASALGIVLGIELVLPGPLSAESAVRVDHLNVFSDMILAGIATCGFAVIYNAGWAQVGMAVVGGMTGHGLRFLAMDFGCWPEAATLLGGFAVGGVTGWIARSYRTPVALIAFAGAVTMMPGLQIYGALHGGLQLARLKSAADLTSLGETLGDASQAFLVVAALVVGLVVGARLVFALAGERDFPGALSKPPHNSEQTTGAFPRIR